MGSIEPLANGNEFVGWGSAPYLSEFSPTGQLLLEASCRIPTSPTGPGSSRGSDCRCTRRPAPPGGTAGGTTVYASWNGATQVASWRVLAGSGRARSAVVATNAEVGLRDRDPRGWFLTPSSGSRRSTRAAA